jgi:hypothetical protein
VSLKELAVFSSNFRGQLSAAAAYLESRCNPTDGGWGLNIERDFQESSIVNTAEAVFVINRGSLQQRDHTKARKFLEQAVCEHPEKRGRRMRYYTFGVFGLLECGASPSSDGIATCIAAIVKRFDRDQLGCTESDSETQFRLWPTFQALSALASVRGVDSVRNDYTRCIEHLIDLGKQTNFRWGFGEGDAQSLGATAYASILLSMLYPTAPEAAAAYSNVQDLLGSTLQQGTLALEVESLPGTDWHHYSYCWAVKALLSNVSLMGHETLRLVSRVLAMIALGFIPGKGYAEPGKGICNVRSIYNNVAAVSAVIAAFDPSWLIDIGHVISALATRLGSEDRDDEIKADALNTDGDNKEREQLYLQGVSSVADNTIERIRILRSLTGGYSGAILDLCECWHKGGVPGVYQVLKLTSSANADQEAAGSKLAAEVVPPEYRVDLFGICPIAGANKSVLRYRYAGGDLMPGNVVPFLEYFQTGNDEENIAGAVSEVFERALANCVSGAQPMAMSLRYLRQYFDELRQNRFWSEIVTGIDSLQNSMAIVGNPRSQNRVLLRFPYRTVYSFLTDSKKQERMWGDLFLGASARLAHRDLNPRNILMVQKEARFRPILIDFHRFGSDAPLALDFSRLEAGVTVKGLKPLIETCGLNPDTEEELVTYAGHVNRDLLFVPSALQGLTPLVCRAGSVAQSIRHAYKRVAPPQLQDDSRLYFGTLALCYLSYVRPIYSSRLSLRQRLYSFYCGANILEALFLQ